LKKQEKQMAAPGEGAAPTETGTTGATAAAAHSTGKKDDVLFKRVGEVLRAGCGTGVLAEATSRTPVAAESNYTKICLSLGSGLSLLLDGGGPSESRVGSRAASPSTGIRPTTPGIADSGGGQYDDAVREDHHYDLLLRPQDMSRLARCAGKIGIVTIPHTLGELTGLGDYHLQQLEQQQQQHDHESDSSGSSRPNSPSRVSSAASVSSSRSGATKESRASTTRHKKDKRGAKKGGPGGGGAKKASSLARLGMEARSFEVEVPRGRWTHLALVATAYPHNKLTLYMVRTSRYGLRLTQSNLRALLLTGRYTCEDPEGLCLSSPDERSGRRHTEL
jgi:hypothetical protein